MLQITDRKYYSEWRNGSAFTDNAGDYSPNLIGSVGERIKMVATIYSTQVTQGTEQNPYSIECDANGLYNLIKRIQGSWVDDGYIIGDLIHEVAYYDGIDHSNGTPTTPYLTFSATVLSVSEKILTITNPQVVGGSPMSAHGGRRPNNAVIGSARPVFLQMKFGLVENSDTSLNMTSPFSNDMQGYYYETISGTPTTHTMLPIGGSTANKNWNSGSATVKFEASDSPLSLVDAAAAAVNYRHKFTVTQIFNITPVYLEEYQANFEDGTQPDNFIGTKSLKHQIEYEFRTVANNSNTDIVGRDADNSGNVGWYGENYNGKGVIYSVSVTDYKDSVTADLCDTLQSKRKTTVRGTITGTGFSNTDKVGFYFHHCSILDQYKNAIGTFQDAFLFDNIIHSMVAGTKTTTGTARIKRFKTDYVSGTSLTFEADIELTSAQATFVEDENYFIGIQIGNTNADATSNKTILPLDFQPWTVDPDVTGLCTFKNQGFLLHNQDAAESGYQDVKAWIEDGVLFKDTIVLNKTLEASLRGLKAQLGAYNSTTKDFFALQEYEFNLNDVISANTSPREQRVDLDTTRKFKLAVGDLFNEVTLTFNPVSGTTQEIDVTWSLKIDWQKWSKNKDASKIFADQTLASNGLGNDASRYSGVLGYEIKLRLEADVDQYDTATADFTPGSTKYTDESPNLKIYDYGKDAAIPAQWSYIIETFDTAANDLSGKILKTADTKMKITWTPLSGSTASFSDSWAIHRIESLNAIGYGDIDELSSIRESRIGNLLKPLVGESYLKITDSGTTIVTECLIDYTKLGGLNYRLSGRLGILKIYGRYGKAQDFQFLDAGRTQAVLFNGEITLLTNALRYADLDANYNVIKEYNIVLDAGYDYVHPKIAVSPTEISSGKNAFYMVTYNGATTDLHHFAYNGTTYIQTTIFSAAIGGTGPACIRIDPALDPNGRSFVWFGNLGAGIGGGYGFKTAYWNGAAYVFTNVNVYDAGISNTYRYPIDINFYDDQIYIMNQDTTGAKASNQVAGKIGYWKQTAGSVTDPTDRSTWANYTWQHDLYLNTAGHVNVDGAGNVGDMAYALGMEFTEIDSNNWPRILASCQADSNSARHFVRIRANTATPSGTSSWTIETPMAFTNGLYGAPEALSGTASATAASSPLRKHYSNHICIIDADEFITGNEAYYWTKFKINSWTGASNNSWYINAPFDAAYDFTAGDKLTQ